MRKIIQKYLIYSGLIVIIGIYLTPLLLMIIVKLIDNEFYHALKMLIPIYVSLLMLFFPIIFFNIKINKYFMFLSPLFSFIPIVILPVLVYHKMPTNWMIFVTLDANKQEIIEFVTLYFYGLFFIIALPIAVLFISRRYLPKRIYFGKKVKIFYISSIFILLILIGTIKSTKFNDFKEVPKSSFKSLYKNTPVHFAERIFRGMYAVNTKRKYSRIPSISAVKENKTAQREVYVLILGESARFGNWSINGYHRETSPSLSTIDNLVSYSDIISPSFITRVSIPLIITDQTSYQTSNPLTYISLMDLFNEVGFKTAWITNQDRPGSIIGLLASRADTVIRLDKRKTNRTDGQLIVKFKQFLNQDSTNLFCVVHTIGSHFPYNKRYPEKFNQFQPSGKERKYLPAKRKFKREIVNGYDNSILYTDFIISSIIKMLKKENIVSGVVYISDHGENLFDDEISGFGRGFTVLSKNVFHISMFVWMSEEYISNNANNAKNIFLNRHQKLSSENVFYTFADFANITWEGFRIEKSFFQKNHKPPKRYIILEKGIAKYDSLFQTN